MSLSKSCTTRSALVESLEVPVQGGQKPPENTEAFGPRSDFPPFSDKGLATSLGHFHPENTEASRVKNPKFPRISNRLLTE